MPGAAIPDTAILAIKRIDNPEGEVCSVRSCVSGAEYWASSLCNPLGEVKLFLCARHFHQLEFRARLW